MDTSLVELDIFLLKIFYMFREEFQHVIFAVIGLLAQYLVRQCPYAAVALQRPLADLKQLAQVLIVKEPYLVRHVIPFFRCFQGKQHLVLTVKPFKDGSHPLLKQFLCQQFHSHVLLPFFCLPFPVGSLLL